MKIPGISFLKTKKLIVTHDGGFHADDVFAAATLSLVFEKEDQPFIIRRSRESGDIERADIVFDVGSVYDPEKGRFDHHQAEGGGKRENGIPYASFGLIWKHFGMKISDSEYIWKAVDNQLASPIDAPDNGFTLATLTVPGVQPFYLGDVLNTLFARGQDPDKEFFQAVLFAKRIISEFMEKIKAGEEIKNKIIEVYESGDDKRLAILDVPTTRQMVWVSLVDKPEVLFTVFSSRTSGDWKILGMKNDLSVFKVKKDLPASWSGLQGEELSLLTGVPGAIFCHRNLFLASAETREGAIAMAKLALNNN